MQFELLTLKADSHSDVPFMFQICNISIDFKHGTDQDRALLYIQRDWHGTWMLEIGFIRIL